MNKILFILILCFPFLSHAGVTLKKTDKLDRLAIQKLHRAQIKFLIEWEKKNSKLPAREKYHDLYSLIERVRDYVIADAYAQDATSMCIFGGWVSKRNSRGTCELPWQNRSFATGRGVTGYGPACGGTLFRCNPALFGGANAPCVQPTSNYSGLTSACDERAGNWLERLSNTEFEQWKQTSFTPMQGQISQFCSGSSSPYNDNTCTSLNQMITKVTAESARRAAAGGGATSATTCPVEGGEAIASGQNQTKQFFQPRPDTGGECPVTSKTRTCTNGAFGEWTGDAAFTLEACPAVATTETRACDVEGSDPIAHGQNQSKQFFQARPAGGGECPVTTKTRVCTNGTLGDWNGDAAFNLDTCPAPAAPQAACTPEGADPVPSGQNQTARFFMPRPAAGGDCPSTAKTRLCTNGTLGDWVGDASFTLTTCPPAPAPAPTPTPTVVADPTPTPSPATVVVPAAAVVTGAAIISGSGEVPPTPAPVVTTGSPGGLTVVAPEAEVRPPTPTPTPTPTPQPAARQGRLVSMSLVGGSADDEFFDDGGTAFNSALRSLGSNGDVYYGGQDRQGNCYSTYKQTIQLNGQFVPMTSLRTNFNPQTCSGAGDVVYAMAGMSDVHQKICPPGPRAVAPGVQPRGQARGSGMMALATTSSLQPGDTFYLNIADHGMLDEKTGRWYIGMSDGTNIYADDVKSRIRALAQRGVNVQLSADACFSGGFSREIMNLQTELFQAGGSHGRVCATSSQDPNLVGYGSDPILKAGYSEKYFPALQQYQNQLSASACAAGADMINRPTSSLLEYVRNFNRGRNTPTPASVSDNCDLREFDNSVGRVFQNLEQNMANISLRAEREALLADFRELYLNPLKACWQENQNEVRFARQLSQCLDRPTTPPTPDELKKYVQDAFGDLSGSRQDFDDVVQYTKFFGDPNVTANDINRFKADFCCLARNMRTGALPASCQ